MQLHRSPIYVLIVVLLLCAWFSANIFISGQFMRESTFDEIAPKVPKWKLILGFWCWVLYQIAWHCLDEKHPWRVFRIGLTGFVRYGTKLFFQFGVIFWYGLVQMALLIYLLNTIK